MKDAEEKLNEELRQGVGLQKHPMQPGNYSRQLTQEKAMAIVLNLIPEGRRDVFERLVNKFNLLKIVWKSSKPRETCPELERHYAQHAQCFMDLLKKDFKYTQNNMPNYLHKVVAHVPALIEMYGSVGIFSSEPNEHGNKLFRQFRKMNARQHSQYELSDILKFHWLYTSRRLQKLVIRNVPRQVCSKCRVIGHNRRTCKMV